MGLAFEMWLTILVAWVVVEVADLQGILTLALRSCGLLGLSRRGLGEGGGSALAMVETYWTRACSFVLGDVDTSLPAFADQVRVQMKGVVVKCLREVEDLVGEVGLTVIP